MITINVTSGNQVEGLQIDAPLDQDFFATAGDGEKVAAIVSFLQRYMTIRIGDMKDWTLSNAEQYVIDNTTRIS